MKRNGMCPICFVKRFFNVPSKVSEVYPADFYGNGAALTPPMGWSSWNTFRNRIDENLIYDTAVAMKEKGLSTPDITLSISMTTGLTTRATTREEFRRTS